MQARALGRPEWSVCASSSTLQVKERASCLFSACTQTLDRGRQRDLLPTNYFELQAESHATDEPYNQHNHNNYSYQTQT